MLQKIVNNIFGLQSYYHRHLLGVFYKILALSSFCILSLSFENPESYEMDSITQLGILSFLATCLLVPAVIYYRKELTTSNLRLYPLRAILSIAAMICWIEAIKYFGSVNSILVNYLSPIITVSIAALFNTEKIKLNYVFLGFICYLVIAYSLRAELEISYSGFIFALLSTILWSSCEVICKRQASSEHFIIQAFYTFLFASLFLFPFYAQNLINLNPTYVPSFISMSLLRIFNILLLFLAIKSSTLNWLAPVSYLKFGLIAYWAYILQNTVPKIEHIITVIILIALNIIALRMQKSDKPQHKLVTN